MCMFATYFGSRTCDRASICRISYHRLLSFLVVCFEASSGTAYCSQTTRLRTLIGNVDCQANRRASWHPNHNRHSAPSPSRSLSMKAARGIGAEEGLASAPSADMLPVEAPKSPRISNRNKKAKMTYDAEYEVINSVRFVKTFAKGRWLGRQLFEVLTTEFGGHPPAYWEYAILSGHLTINGGRVNKEYRFRNSDVMFHRTHRHEPPVHGVIALVENAPDLVAVSKPASMPMHPCGSYHHNTLTHIIVNEPVIPNQPPLMLVHRLDRVTSGLVILAKTKEAANRISKEIYDNKTQKTYLARVKGKFPKNLSLLQELNFEAIHRDVIEIPVGNEESSVEPSRKRFRRDEKNEILPPDNDSDVVEGAGVGDTDCSVDPDVYSHPDVGYMTLNDDKTSLLLRCSIGVISHRNGVYGNNPIDGKVAVTKFTALSYRDSDDTTLLECMPLTGRTHQIRLHLQLLGNPIANDPCYGGELFYGHPEKRARAVEVLHHLRSIGKHPLGNVNHLLKLMGGVGSDVKSTLGQANTDVSIPSDSYESYAKRPGESDLDHLVRTCKYCQHKLDPEMERVLHCDEIWLHALRYEGEGFRFETPLPIWA